MTLSNEQKLVKLRRLSNATDPLGVAKELEVLADKDTELKAEIDTLEEKQNMLQDIPMKIDDMSQTLAEVHSAVTHQEDTGEIIIKIDPAKIMGKTGEQGGEGRVGERGPIGPVGLQGAQGEAGRDGVDGRDGRDGIDGKDGQNGSPDLPEQVADKLNSLEQVVEQNVIIGLVDEIKKLREEISRKPMTGMRKITSVRSVDLSASVDGSATTFTLPQDTLKVLGVWSSQFPVTFRDGTDWTFAGRTLTLVTTQIGVPQTGQTLWALVETAFYAK